MPLSHTPYRPRPVVEFLDSRPISAEDAARGLASSVEIDDGSNGSTLEVRYELPGSTLVNFRQIPGIIDALQTDWVGLPCRERPADCFVEVRGRLETHLHPCFLGEKLALGLRGVAGTMLLRFNRMLQCVPLGFTQLLPAGTHGAIVGESPYVHFLAAFRAVGFVPQEGQWLVGRASEQQTAQGLNVLILNCFNMFIRKKSLPQQLRFDEEKNGWSYKNDKDKAVMLKAKRGPLWVQASSSAQESKGSVPSLFGTLPWPCLAAESGEALSANKDKKEKKEKKEKREKKEKDGRDRERKEEHSKAEQVMESKQEDNGAPRKRKQAELQDAEAPAVMSDKREDDGSKEKKRKEKKEKKRKD